MTSHEKQCIRECKLDKETQTCTGCGRTLAEIVDKGKRMKKVLGVLINITNVQVNMEGEEGIALIKDPDSMLVKPGDTLCCHGRVCYWTTRDQRRVDVKLLREGDHA